MTVKKPNKKKVKIALTNIFNSLMIRAVRNDTQNAMNEWKGYCMHLCKMEQVQIELKEKRRMKLEVASQSLYRSVDNLFQGKISLLNCLENSENNKREFLNILLLLKCKTDAAHILIDRVSLIHSNFFISKVKRAIAIWTIQSQFTKQKTRTLTTLISRKELNTKKHALNVFSEKCKKLNITKEVFQSLNKMATKDILRGAIILLAEKCRTSKRATKMISVLKKKALRETFCEWSNYLIYMKKQETFMELKKLNLNLIILKKIVNISV